MGTITTRPSSPHTMGPAQGGTKPRWRRQQRGAPGAVPALLDSPTVTQSWGILWLLPEPWKFWHRGVKTALLAPHCHPHTCCGCPRFFGQQISPRLERTSSCPSWCRRLSRPSSDLLVSFVTPARFYFFFPSCCYLISSHQPGSWGKKGSGFGAGWFSRLSRHACT